ncbi:Predicted PurR-regulated permease PerM [Paraburkholderia lycopersici]|uniref:Predicted PurR-regulated permease PerM n=2 Tax=Paraburkholderia lycopersici TaxID=416944 RepID=A0A1G6HCU0_9BURK|nr:Predicted PurR-regulated permease PerM [Paraburkholderia lycopersici]
MSREERDGRISVSPPAGLAEAQAKRRDAGDLMKQDLITCTCVVVVVAITGWVLYIGRPVLVPIAFAIITSYVIYGLAEILRRVPHVGKRIRAGVRYWSAAALILVAAWLATELLLSDTDRMLAVAPKYEATLLALLAKLTALLHLETEASWTAFRRELLAVVNVQALLTSLLGSLSSLMATTLVVFLYTAFFMVEMGRFRRKLSAVMRGKADMEPVIDAINSKIGTYLALKALLGVVLGILSWICMQLVGLEFAPLLAVLIVMLNFVPYAGSLISVAFPALLAALQFGQWNEPIVLLISLSAINFVMGNVLDPWLMAGSLNLSPAVILMSLAAWTAIWGIAGAFLAVPGTVALTIIFSAFSSTRPLALLLTKDDVASPAE